MNLARFYFGVLLIALGGVLILGQADVIDAGRFLEQWWPVAVIGAAVLTFIANPKHWLSPMVIGGVGVVLLLNTTDAISADAVPLAWAVALLIVGVAVLTGALSGPRSGDSANRVNAFAAFGGRKIVSHSSHFEGGTMGAVFGGTELDLRDAELAPEASLDVFAAFGGAEVRVPVGWRVETHGMPWFGGFENVAEGEGDEHTPTLDINATVLFGALEVKH